MPIPQLNDRIKEAPAMVLRAIFAGVGQVLLAVDKLRAEVLDHGDQAGTTTSQPAGTAARPAAPPPAVTAAGPAEAPGAEEPSNIRVLREPAPPAAATAAEPAGAKPAAPPEPAAAKPAGPEPAAAKLAVAKPAAARSAAKPAAAKPATAKPAAAKPPRARPAAKPAAAKPASPAAAAPLANYGELTIASLRARLRGLDADSVRGLLDYEKAHANREAVVTMYERRLEKIASEAG